MCVKCAFDRFLQNSVLEIKVVCVRVRVHPVEWKHVLTDIERTLGL